MATELKLDKNLDNFFIKIASFIKKEGVESIKIENLGVWYPGEEKVELKGIKFKNGVARKGKEVYYNLSEVPMVKVEFKNVPSPSRISYIKEILELILPLYIKSKKSEKDSLTGFYNYAHFKDESVRVIKEVQKLIHQGKTAIDIDTEITRGESPRFSLDISFLHMDIDYFKRINDSLGHRVGDVVLVSFTRYMRDFFSSHSFLKSLPLSPVIGRLGGEEFGILIPFLGERKAYEIADSFRKFIENASLPHPQIPREDLPQIPGITISIGVATLDSSVIDSIEEDALYMTLERLREQSDIATYVAKKLGRNRVISFSKILHSGGVVLDVDQRTGIVTIDLGSSMGVKVGDVFSVYDKEKFTGETPIIQPGSQKKVVGYFPRIPLGEIKVFMTQDQVSFCKKLGDFYIAPGFLLELKKEGDAFISEESKGKKFKKFNEFKEYFNQILNHQVFHVGVIVIDNFSILKDTKGRQFISKVKKKLEDILNSIEISTFLWTSLSESERGFVVPDIKFEKIIEESEKIKEKFKKETGITLSIGIYSTEKDIRDAKDFSNYSRSDAIELARLTAGIGRFRGGDRVVVFSTSLILEKGLFYYRNREHDKAVKEFEKISKLGVSTPAFHSAYGVSLSMLGRFKEALEQDLKALELDPENPVLHRNLALDLVELGDFQKAVLHFEKAEESLPENLKNDVIKPWMWREYGKVLYNLGRYKEAIQKLSKAISLDPTDGLAYYLRGKSYLKIKQKENARQDIMKSISLGFMDIEAEVKQFIEEV